MSETREFTPPSQVDVKPGGVTTLRLGLGGLITASGRVTLEGRPLPGAEVRLVPAGDLLDEMRRAETGEDGRYRVQLASTGSYLAAVSAQEPAVEAVVPLTVPAGGGSLPDIALSAVTSLEVDVESPTGEPLEKTAVTVWPRAVLTGLHPMSRRQLEARATSDEKGRALIAGLAPGDYQVGVRAEGLGSVLESVTIRDGDDSESVSLRLPGSVSLRGTVVNEEGRALRRAALLPLEETGDAPWFDRPVETDDAGAFELPDMPERPMILAVTAHAHGLALIPVDPGSEPLEVVLAPAGGADVRLTGPSGEPVTADLQLETSDDLTLPPGTLGGIQFAVGGSTLPDQEGWVRLRGLAPGRYTVRALQAGRPAGSTSVTVRAYEISEGRIRVE
jgi:hypothetical protein